MPAVALSRVGARVFESGPGGEDLAAGAWHGWRRCRIRARRRGGSTRWPAWSDRCLRFYCCRERRFTAVGQWVRRAGQADLARLRAPWDPVAGRYRATDEKTIQVVLDRLDPRALTRALLGPRPRRRRAGRPRPPCAITAPGGPPGRQKHWPAAGCGRWPWTARSRAEPAAPRHPGYFLGAAEHGGHLLDHVEVDVKHNETSHFTELLEPVDLDGAV